MLSNCRINSYRAAKKANRPAKAAGATTAPAAEELEVELELLDEEVPVAEEPEELVLVEVPVETAVPSLETVLVSVDSPVAVDEAAESVPVTEAVLVTGPQLDTKEACRLSRADLALASRTEFSERRALPLRVDWAAASSEASWVCTLWKAVCKAE